MKKRKRIGTFIKQLKNKKISHNNLPDVYKNNSSIIELEKQLGTRNFTSKGFDIINNNFFVNEEIIDFKTGKVEDNNNFIFETFEDYYNFLGGKIYDNACYYMYKFDSDTIDRYDIDLKKINYISLINNTIEDITISNYLKNFDEQYENGEIVKKFIDESIKKICDCKSSRELKNFIEQLMKKNVYSKKVKDVLIFNFIRFKPQIAFDILIDSINKDYLIITPEELCVYYSTDAVMGKIDYALSERSKSDKIRKIKKLKNFSEDYNSNNYQKKYDCSFDNEINYYQCTELYYRFKNPRIPIYVRYYFKELSELARFLGGDLSNCDFSFSKLKNEEILSYKVNTNTKFSILNQNVHLKTNKKYENDEFIVDIDFMNDDNNVIYSIRKKFKYFFDFVYFFKNDLSNSDLLFCDGLANIEKDNNIIFDNAHIRSNIMDKLNIKYDTSKKERNLYYSNETLSNEKDTKVQLYSKRELAVSDLEWYKSNKIISYVSDIHLDFKIKNCKTLYDVEYTIKRIVKELLEDCSSTLLIAGDVASNYNLYKLFIEELGLYVKSKDIKIFCTLGNHEFFGLSRFINDIKNYEIIETYYNLLKKNNMFLVYNNLYFFDDYGINELRYSEIQKMNLDEIKNKLRMTYLVITGGLGFPEYCEKNNYADGKNRVFSQNDILETKIFEDLYLKLIECIAERNTIVLTHFPKINCRINKDYVKNWVYVNGHTHRNYYYDDGECRIYADNQLGYENNQIFLKKLSVEYDYDLFYDYEDGIYEITRDQYISFYRGKKNIAMTYNRSGYIYMLKKNDYYCFIKPNSSNGLSILNGGALKSLKYKDINYYYDNMDYQIMLHKKPLDIYSGYQEKVSNFVKKIGGLGRIHGCIVDIDFNNHIYVNPFDGTLSGYYAYDIIEKYVYKNIHSLLKARLPQLYFNYEKLLQSKEENTLAIIAESNDIVTKSTFYDSTDIYNASREIKKMQRLKSGILTTWVHKEIDEETLLEYKDM